MKWLLTLFAFPLFATPQTEYFELLKTYSKTLGIIGNHEKGEIELATAPLEIEEIEGIAKNRLLQKGVNPKLAEEWSHIGIVAEDQYLYWIRDGVIFPTGAKGTYDRVIWKSGIEKNPGIAILPLLPDRKVVVNLNYRHATRSWEIELPRGMRQNEESLLAAAQRELLEETGYALDNALMLGTLAVDSGILSALVPVFACTAKTPTDKNQDYSEAIYENLTLSIDELETALLQGFWNVELPNKSVRAFVRDPFLAYAILQIKLRHWKI